MSHPASTFQKASGDRSKDLVHRGRIQKALDGYYLKRDHFIDRFQDWGVARQNAADIKWKAVGELDKHLLAFEERLQSRGGQVHWARNAQEAREIILGIIQKAEAKLVVKSKCMTSEEIHLNQALEALGYEVIESDLGEYIVQLRGEAPYHFVFPAMHLSRQEISEVFEKNLGTAPSDSPEELTMIARGVMRLKYCQADVGITGANFAIAETGQISITENEGNARLTLSLPRVHIALMGIEKVLPKIEDLALFLPMLATSGAGQPLTAYNNVVGGPRQPGESDGPEEFHVVLLDNHRTALLADPQQRDALHCIRCGACLNVCPIFKNVGGHSYGTTYQGPIGSVITPHLRGLQDWKHLSGASSLCGACTEACPVGIDIHHHLLRNRRNAASKKPKFFEGLAHRGFGWVTSRPKIYQFALRCARLAQPLHKPIAGRIIDPLLAWTKRRNAPVIASQTFREWWNKQK